MDSQNFSAQLKTEIGLKPEKSQILVTLLALTSALCYGVGFLFLWHKPVYSWAPLLLGMLLTIASIWTWRQSRSAADLVNAQPTTISKEGSCVHLTTDTGALTSNPAVQNLATLLSIIAARQPLPEPSGLIDKSGSPISAQRDEAIKRVKAVNDEAIELTRQSLTLLTNRKDIPRAEQPSVTIPTGPDVVKINASQAEDTP